MVINTFFDKTEPVSLISFKNLIGSAELIGDKDCLINGVAPIEDARSGDICFLEKSKYLDVLPSCKASAIILASKHISYIPEGLSALVVDNPYAVFAKIASHLYPDSIRPKQLGFCTQIHDRSVVHETAHLDENVFVEANAVIGAGARIGAGSVVHAGAIIGQNVTIGRNCNVGFGAVVQHAHIGDNVIIHPNAALGQDGFGFAPGERHGKIPQLGRVIIQDDVEIGANTCIDRGTTRDTIIGEGTKIDNQVQIAHNCVIGRHCFIVARVGLSGSTTLGDYVTMAGASATVGHLSIGSFSQIAGMSAVTENLPANSRVGGVPAIPIRYFLQDLAKARRRGTGKERGKT